IRRFQGKDQVREQKRHGDPRRPLPRPGGCGDDGHWAQSPLDGVKGRRHPRVAKESEGGIGRTGLPIGWCRPRKLLDARLLDARLVIYYTLMGILRDMYARICELEKLPIRRAIEKASCRIGEHRVEIWNPDWVINIPPTMKKEPLPGHVVTPPPPEA